MSDIFTELSEIGRMLKSASALAMVRQEVGKVMRSGFVVTDNVHQEGASDYDVVVRCGSGEDKVSRRLRENMPDMDVTHIAEGVLGVKKSRRARHGG
jgi:hypothetical protein